MLVQKSQSKVEDEKFSLVQCLCQYQLKMLKEKFSSTLCMAMNLNIDACHLLFC